MIIYCTNDCLSAHTRKRCAYFDYYGIEYKILGISNLSNKDGHSEFDTRYKTKNIGSSRYIFRVYYSIRVLWDLQKEKDCVIIFRGYEFLFWIPFFKQKCYFELTDIPNVVLKFQILRRILTILCSRISIISTSPYYLNLLKSDSKLIWHNVPFFDVQEKREVKLYSTNSRVIYAGYLRGLDALQTTYSWLYENMDFFGKKNILNSSVHLLGKNYFGEYMFEDMPKIYSIYTFGYVSDFYGPNSTYNLTNRIYEVIFSGCIPVHVKTDALSYFLDELKIFYISTKDQFEHACAMDKNEIIDIVNLNYRILHELVHMDFARLNSHLI